MFTSLISGRDTSPPPSPRPRVLVVEDDGPTRGAMTHLLGAWGLEVRTAGTVAAALDALAWEPVCVVLDLMLPDGSGLEVLRHVRRKSLPVRVAIATGASDPALLAAASRLRPDLILRKPVDVRVLRAFLATC